MGNTSSGSGRLPWLSICGGEDGARCWGSGADFTCVESPNGSCMGSSTGAGFVSSTMGASNATTRLSVSESADVEFVIAGSWGVGESCITGERGVVTELTGDGCGGSHCNPSELAVDATASCEVRTTCLEDDGKVAMACRLSPVGFRRAVHSEAPISTKGHKH